MTYYYAFVCRKCGRAQGTYYNSEETEKEKKTCKCKFCNYSTKLFNIKNPIKILKEGYNLSEITQIIQIYNANSNKVAYDYQKGESKQNWETEIKVYSD
jgi:hypothetical protein